MTTTSTRSSPCWAGRASADAPGRASSATAATSVPSRLRSRMVRAFSRCRGLAAAATLSPRGCGGIGRRARFGPCGGNPVEVQVLSSASLSLSGSTDWKRGAGIEPASAARRAAVLTVGLPLHRRALQYLSLLAAVSRCDIDLRSAPARPEPSFNIRGPKPSPSWVACRGCAAKVEGRSRRSRPYPSTPGGG